MPENPNQVGVVRERFPGTAAGQQYGCEPDGRKATFIDSIGSPFLTCVKRWRCATIIPQAKQRSR
jgi:hypothetical protein